MLDEMSDNEYSNNFVTVSNNSYRLHVYCYVCCAGLYMFVPARLAQSVEHETLNLRVVGSSPTSGASFFFVFFPPEGQLRTKKHVHVNNVLQLYLFLMA